MGTAEKNPAPLAGGNRVSNFEMLGSFDVTASPSDLQDHQANYLCRRLHLPSIRAAALAPLVFGGAR